MSPRSVREHRTTPAAVVALLVVVVLAAVTAYVAVAPKPRGSSSNVNQEGTMDENADTAVDAGQASSGVRWPSFYHQPMKLYVPIPTGMNFCDGDQATFVVRADACAAKSLPFLAIRRDAAWDGKEVTTVFNETFAQELREAGFDGLADRGTVVEGPYVTTTYVKLSDSLYGAVVRERDGSRTIVVNGRPKADIRVESQPADFAATFIQVLKGIRFSSASPAANTNEAPAGE